MELLVELCLTTCGTVSYRLWKWLASSSPIYGTALGQFLGKQFSPFMEMVSKHFFHLWNCASNLKQSAPIRRRLRPNSRLLKQNSAPATTVSEKLTPDVATILSQLRARRKKSPVSLTDIEAILEIIEES
jgi:hypothetical protein